MAGMRRNSKAAQAGPDREPIAVLEEKDIPPLSDDDYAALEAIAKKAAADDDYVLIDGPAW